MLEHEIRRQCNEERLKNILQLDEPKGHQGHDDGRMGEQCDAVATLLGVPQGRLFHDAVRTGDLFKTSPLLQVDSVPTQGLTIREGAR